MLQVKTLAIASLIALLPIQGYAQSEPSNQMTEFLAFDREGRNGFISTSVMMLGVIASQTQPQIARCVDSWYGANNQVRESRNAEIIEVMERFPDYLPSAVVLAVVERECGNFQRVD